MTGMMLVMLMVLVSYCEPGLRHTTKLIHTYSTHMYMMCFTVDKDEVRVTASKEEQQRLLQQYQRMGRARDVQISQLQNENELVQDKCKLTLNSHTPIPQLLCTFMYSLPIMTIIYYCPVDTLTISYRQLQVSSNEEKQQFQDQNTQLESRLPAQQLPTSSSLSDHHQEGSHAQNGELRENHITIYTNTVNCTYQQLSDHGLWILLTLVFKQII